MTTAREDEKGTLSFVAVTGASIEALHRVAQCVTGSQEKQSSTCEYLYAIETKYYKCTTQVHVLGLQDAQQGLRETPQALIAVFEMGEEQSWNETRDMLESMLPKLEEVEIRLVVADGASSSMSLGCVKEGEDTDDDVKPMHK